MTDKDNDSLYLFLIVSIISKQLLPGYVTEVRISLKMNKSETIQYCEKKKEKENVYMRVCGPHGRKRVKL